MSKQKRNRLIDAENILTVARWEGGWGLGEIGKGIKKYKLAVTKQSWGCKVERREHSQ